MKGQQWCNVSNAPLAIILFACVRLVKQMHTVHTQLVTGIGGVLGRWWRYQRAVEIPTRHHLCSASGFYSSDRLTHSISIPGIPQQLISSSLSQGHCLFLHPTILDSWPHIPTVTLASKKVMCLSGFESPILLRLGSAFTDILWLDYVIFKQYRKTQCVIINYPLLYET